MQEDLVIHKLFSKLAARFPQQISMQVTGDYSLPEDGSLIRKSRNKTVYTYSQIESLAKKIACLLIKHGYQKGERAVLSIENCPEWGIVYLGIMYAGLICVAVDYDLNREDIKNILDDCRPVIIFTSYTIKQKIDILNRNIEVIIIDGEDFDKIKAENVKNVCYPEVLPSDIASLIYTSGTTAIPKGVMLTHHNFCSNFESIKKLDICSFKDNFLSILPLYHTYAFMVTFLVPLLSGAKITYMKSVKPEDLSRVVRDTGITIFTGVPQLFSLMYKAIFEKVKKIPVFLRPLFMPVVKQKIRAEFGKSLRFLVSGGARLDPSIAKGLSRLGFSVVEGYGLTETSPVVSLNPPLKTRYGSAGKVLPGVNIRIINADQSGVGDIEIKGPNVMLGYFKQPDLTNQVKSYEGWFNSQDLGYLDKDGYLFITGRKKDIIVLSSGKNIYPEELEEYYLRSPYIKEICIFDKSQEQFGREIKLLFAVVVPDFKYFYDTKVRGVHEKIRRELDNLSSNLPSYKRIMGFCIRKDEFPRTRLKKIKRYEIAELYLNQKVDLEENEDKELSLEDKAVLDSKIGRRVIGYLSKQLKRKVNLDSHLEIDLGIDSLGRVELVMGLESNLCMKIPQELVENVSTIKELIINIQQIKLEPPVKMERTWNELIKETPPKEMLAKIRISSGFIDNLFVGVIQGILRSIYRLFWPLEIEGVERLSLLEGKPFVFCPNHSSYLDGFTLFVSLPKRYARSLFFIGHAKIFEHFLIKWAVKIGRLISIDPVIHLTETLQIAHFVFKHKKLICIFPEGERSFSGEIQDFKKGIGVLAIELNMPIVPVYINGTFSAWPRTKRFPQRSPVKIIFGNPVFGRELGNDYSSVANELREKVLDIKTHSKTKQ